MRVTPKNPQCDPVTQGDGGTVTTERGFGELDPG